MADKISSVGSSCISQVQTPLVQKTPLQQHSEDVAKVFFDTRDESGLSDKTFKVLEKDWGRFVQYCNSASGHGEAPKPLPMEEANNDFMDYVSYMKEHGDKIKIGSTGSNMKDIIESDMAEAKKNSKNGFQLVTNLAHYISQDQRIPNDYCFLRQPAEEFNTAAVAFLQTPE